VTDWIRPEDSGIMLEIEALQRAAMWMKKHLTGANHADVAFRERNLSEMRAEFQKIRDCVRFLSFEIDRQDLDLPPSPENRTARSNPSSPQLSPPFGFGT
jgi:hypothetical protein